MKAKITENNGSLLALFGYDAPKGFSCSGYRYHGSGKPGSIVDARLVLHGSEIVATDMRFNVKIGATVRLTLADNKLGGEVFKVTKVNPTENSWLHVKMEGMKKGFDLQDGEFEFVNEP